MRTTSDVMGRLEVVTRRGDAHVKRVLTILTPLVVVGLLLFILIDFKHVKRLDAEERQVIERYKKEQLRNGHLRVRGIFSEAEYKVLSTSLERLHEGANYKVFGRKFGIQLENHKDEFKKVRDLLEKKESPQKQKEFLAALQVDIAQAEKHFGTRVSHDLLSDLSYYVFPKEKQKKERQYANPKTLHVMKKMKIKVS